MSELGTLGKYELKSEIGRGSSGTVYLATDSFTREDVALKVLDKRLLDDPEHRRVVQGQFLNEASLVGKLAHPHIVSILDASVGDNYGYIAMEYVAGGSLRALTDSENLAPVEKIIEIGFKCCGALDYAHRQGIIHRDIKPANIMVVNYDNDRWKQAHAESPGSIAVRRCYRMPAPCSKSIRARCIRLRAMRTTSIVLTRHAITRIRQWLAAILCVPMALMSGAAAHAQPALMTGQTLYLPVYSHVYHGDVDSKGAPQQTLVSALASIRNADLTRSIRVTSAVYYDTNGKKLREYLPKPVVVPPMGTHEIYVPRSDTAGGSGANFVIVWQADAPANAPVVEALHLNMPAGRSIAFITTARPIATR